MFGVVEHVELSRDPCAQGMHECVDRTVAFTHDRHRSIIDNQLGGDRCATRGGAAAQFVTVEPEPRLRREVVLLKGLHMMTGLISVPESSVMCWIVLEN